MGGFSFAAERPIEKYHKSDILFLISVILLWGLGFFALFICSQNYAQRMFDDSFYFVKRQFITSCVGGILFLFFLLSDIKYIRKLVSIIVISAFVLCLLTFIPGISVEKNGAARWIRLPFSFSFQPSELVKFGLVLFLANYFDKQERLVNPEEKNVAPCVGVFIIFLVTVAAQKDFSTTAFIACVCILMFVVAGAKIAWLIPFLIVVIPICIIMIFSQQYRIERILGFINPDEFATTLNFQSLAAKKAISAGGIWGQGIGTDLVKINLIPEIQADYIFAGWAEAMGLVGVIFYFAVLGLFAWRGYKSAITCPDRFASYASFGCVSVIFLQSLLNCMVVCGLVPSTGIPLPFFSLGGSSIIVTLAMCGFILNTSRCEDSYEINEKKDENSDDVITILEL